jgi:hypothetical protein
MTLIKLLLYSACSFSLFLLRIVVLWFVASHLRVAVFNGAMDAQPERVTSMVTVNGWAWSVVLPSTCN